MNIAAVTESMTSRRGDLVHYAASSGILVDFLDMYVPSAALREVANYSMDITTLLARSLNARVDFENNLNTLFIPALLELTRERPQIFKRGPNVSVVNERTAKTVSIQNTGKTPLFPHNQLTLIPPLTAKTNREDALVIEQEGDCRDCISVYPPETVEIDRFKRDFRCLAECVHTMATIHKNVGGTDKVTQGHPYLTVMADQFFPRLAGNSIWGEMLAALGAATGMGGNRIEMMRLLLEHFRKYWWPFFLGTDYEGSLTTNSEILEEIQAQLAKLNQAAVTAAFGNFIGDPENKGAELAAIIQAQFQLNEKVRQLVSRICDYEPISIGYVERSSSSPILRGQHMDITFS